MKVVNIPQRSPEWFEWRKKGMTASSVATVLGHDPNKTRWRLWAEMVGKALPEDISRNPYVRRGATLENQVRALCETYFPDEMLLPVCAESSEHPLMRASFDGLTSRRIPTELKFMAYSNIMDALQNGELSKPYKLYWYQVQHQIYVADSDEGYLFLYCDTDLEVQNKNLQRQGVLHKIFHIKRDERFIRDTMLPSLMDFYETVQSGKEPKKDPERDIFVPEGEHIAIWESAAKDYLRTATRLNEATKLIEELKSMNEINQRIFVGLMGDFKHAEAAGVKVTRYLHTGAIDYQAVIKQYAPQLAEDDLERYRKQGRELTRCTLKEKTPEIDQRFVQAKTQQLLVESEQALSLFHSVFHQL